MARPLRAVSAGEGPPKKPVRKTVAQAAESGSRRELLVAMRDRIAETISQSDCPPRDLASLTRRLQDIAREIDQLDMQDMGVNSVVADTDDEPFTP